MSYRYLVFTVKLLWVIINVNYEENYWDQVARNEWWWNLVRGDK